MSTNSEGNTVWLWPGLLMMATPALKNSPHVHFPASLYVGLEDEVEVITDTAKHKGRLVLVRANVEQQVDSGGKPLLDLLIDADGASYRYLEPLLGEANAAVLDYQRVAVLEADMRRALAGSIDCTEAWGLVEQVLISLSAYRPERPDFDPRISQIATELRAELPVNPNVAELAAKAAVSESRFLHLFKQQYGLPVRQYLLWARLRRAADLWHSGSSLADIAAEVGFYDQAHFARTVRRVFDFSPSWLANPQNLTVHNCRCDE